MLMPSPSVSEAVAGPVLSPSALLSPSWAKVLPELILPAQQLEVSGL